jgi:hypothetical protein
MFISPYAVDPVGLAGCAAKGGFIAGLSSDCCGRRKVSAPRVT